MSGFFSLGGGSSRDQDQDQDQDNNNNNNNSSLFLFKNEEIYNKGFELWQQYYQLHQQRHQQHQQVQDHVVDFSVGPSSTSRRNNNNIINGINNSSDETRVMMMRREGDGGSGGINCQDCGNQAKKDCNHMRCRTCCKSRGFNCQTHVKSTWVPAAKRRERQQQISLLQHQDFTTNIRAGEGGGGRRPQTTTSKRLRENINTAGAPAPAPVSRLLTTTTSGFHELGHFPPEVKSQADFRCVRVSAMNDMDEHLAYQTAVSIGGHVFKGILYDQGPENRYPCIGGRENSSQPLDLITTAVATTPSNNQNVTMIDPNLYATTPLTAFMAGTQFFPPPRS